MNALTPEPGGELEPEDAKLVALARSARARIGAPEGAAVRDTNGRTYVATTVSLPSLRLGALEAAVAAAVASGAEGVEAAAVVTAGDGVVAGVEAVRDLGSGAAAVPLLVADPDGRVREILR
jgi:hypothetical protein